MSSQPQATLYAEIMADIRRRISGGALVPGERLPSMSALCEQYGVSKVTILLAVRELKAEGVLESRPRSGVFVRQPPSLDAALTGKRLVALLVTALDDPFYALILQGAEAACRAANFRLVVANSGNDPALEAFHIQELAGQVAGLLLVPVFGRGNYAAYADLLERDVPFVFLDRAVAGLDAPLVASDNEAAGYLATRHLLEQGCREVVLITLANVSSAAERQGGYRRALHEAGIPFDPALVMTANSTAPVEAYSQTRGFVEARTGQKARRRGAWGLFAINDDLASGACVALRELGLKVPRDVRVAGVDDMRGAFMDPPLTTVRQDQVGMGTIGARILFEMLRYGRGAAPRETRLPVELVVRGSTDPKSNHSFADQLEREIKTAAPPPIAGPAPYFQEVHG